MIDIDEIGLTALEVEAVTKAIKPLLAGRGAEVQGAVLADLLAYWLAGHAPQLRESMLELHIEAVKAYTPINEDELFGSLGHPAGRAG